MLSTVLQIVVLNNTTSVPMGVQERELAYKCQSAYGARPGYVRQWIRWKVQHGTRQSIAVSEELNIGTNNLKNK
jgi:hypothetical protein